MPTLGDLKTRIYSELHYTESTAVQNAVESAIRSFIDQRFWFNEAQTTFALSLTTMYSLASKLPNLAELDTLKVWVNSRPYLLSRQPWAKLEDWDAGTGTGTPCDYAIHHEMLRLYPSPSATYTAEASYLKKISMTASASASSVWTNEAFDLIRHRAKALVYAEWMLDTENAQRCETLAQMELDRLQRQTSRFKSTDRVEPYL